MSGAKLSSTDSAILRHPKVTVVVPSFNRPEALDRCLQGLAAQSWKNMEVIVVDDGGSVELERLVAAHGRRFRLVRQQNGGPASARNTGVRHSGEDTALVAFTDDDCVPDAGWVEALATAYVEAPTALLGGRVENLLTRNPFAATSQTLVDFLYSYFGAAEGRSPFFTSNNLACARGLFLGSDGFDETFPLAAAEDREFGMRWRDAGRALTFVPGAEVGHAHRLTLAGFWRQHVNYGRGACHLHSVLAARGSTLPRVEGWAFYLGLLTFPLRRRRARWAAQMLLLVLSQLATVYGYFHEARTGPGSAARHRSTSLKLAPEPLDADAADRTERRVS